MLDLHNGYNAINFSLLGWIHPQCLRQAIFLFDRINFKKIFSAIRHSSPHKFLIFITMNLWTRDLFIYMEVNLHLFVPSRSIEAERSALEGNRKDDTLICQSWLRCCYTVAVVVYTRGWRFFTRVRFFAVSFPRSAQVLDIQINTQGSEKNEREGRTKGSLPRFRIRVDNMSRYVATSLSPMFFSPYAILRPLV